MGTLYDRLKSDVRFQEGLRACIGCGTCTAICPAAEFYQYDPRSLATEVQSKSDVQIEELLKSERIWYCGECMSCKTRCPRGNTPGLIVMALRSLSQELGYFVESEKGRQQLVLKRTVGEWILNTGYCTYLEGVGTDLYPEQGPVWDWRQEHWADVFERLGANYQKDGPGIMRKIPVEAMDELRAIFKETGCLDRFEQIEERSAEKAKEMGLELGRTGINSPYIEHIFTENSQIHEKE